MKRPSQQKSRKEPEPLEIKQRLLTLGISIAELGRKLDRPRESVSRMIHGRRRYSRLRKEVLKALGL